MPADRLLVTLLRALQTSTSQQETPRLLGTASSLLTTLANPRNLSLLTAQLLAAPSIWNLDPSLRISQRFLGTFSSAAVAILKYEDEVAEDPSKALLPPGQPRIGGDLSRDKWVRAVISGADSRSPTWKHTLVLAGLLLGFEGQQRQGLGRSLRRTVASSFVKAVNASLEDVRLGGEERGAHAVVLALNYVFDILEDHEKALLDSDRLLPVLVGSAFFSAEGYRSGYFFASIDTDIAQVSDKQFSWSPRSVSFKRIQDVASQPLLTSMGPLSKLIAHTVTRLRDPFLIQTLVDDLFELSKAVVSQWRQTKLSEVDAREEARYFDETAMNHTLPVLWRLLRSALFTVSIILEAIIGRTLSDSALADSSTAPTLASQTLHTLRNLYFISSRLGSNTLSQYTFIYLTSIDILASHPSAASDFITSIRSPSAGTIPQHPLDRTLDLYFLNTTEHFTLTLSPGLTQAILLPTATPYLDLTASPSDSPLLIELFEAAHALTLAIFSAPQNAHIAAQHVPLYIDALFKAFPTNLSARQFRLAFKTLLRITSPPSSLARDHPDLPEVLMELVYARVTAPGRGEEKGEVPYRVASETESHQQPHEHALEAPTTETDHHEDSPTAFVLTLIDSLPYLPIPLLTEWLPRTAALIPALEGKGRAKARERFWEVMCGGEMDVERSQVCVAWWGTYGGREVVLGGGGGDGEGEMMMSGALGGRGESRL